MERCRGELTTPWVPRARLLGLVLLGAILCTPAWGQPVDPGWKRFEIAATGTYALRYIPFSLATPTPTPTPTPAPVIVFLHGSGSFPENWRFFLVPLAEELGFVLVLPKSVSALGFGVGADDQTVAESLRLIAEEIPLDPTRIALAGHSSGGAYAAVLTYAAPGATGGTRISAVFTLGIPYRTVLAVADPDSTAPIRMFYGTEDPNFWGGSYEALLGQWEHLGIPHEEEIAPGFSHNTWPETTLRDGFAFLLAHPYHTAGGCLPTDQRLCLRAGRFAVEATWMDPAGHTGPARVSSARTGDSGLFYFFRQSNWELQVKVLDGCPINGHYWVFAAGTTDVAFRLRVTDLGTGSEASYENPPGTLAGTLADVEAFPTCP